LLKDRARCGAERQVAAPGFTGIVRIAPLCLRSSRQLQDTIHLANKQPCTHRTQELSKLGSLNPFDRVQILERSRGIPTQQTINCLPQFLGHARLLLDQGIDDPQPAMDRLAFNPDSERLSPRSSRASREKWLGEKWINSGLRRFNRTARPWNEISGTSGIERWRAVANACNCARSASSLINSQPVCGAIETRPQIP